nr:terpene synthase 10-like [Ipomoea batatas]
MNNGETKEAEKIEMIDQLQKLDCSYHFEDEINATLMDIYTKKSSNNYKSSEEKDLYSTALEFRVLRQNGFDISPEVFEGFMDGKRLGFNANLGEDTKGLLNLYEASFLSKEEDIILELARDFSAKHLKQVINGDQNLNDPKLLPHVQRALDIPLHWRAPRLESRSLIDSFDLGKTSSNDSTLLDLAKLDFNIAQAVYLEDLRSVSRQVITIYILLWWKDLCITEKLEFVRDKVVENFIWALSKTSSPKYSHCRRVVTKIDVLLCTVDDLYDIYGTLDELQLFTETIERWDDITQVGHLPEKMQFCYFAVHNFANEVAYDILKEHNVDILPYLRKEGERFVTRRDELKEKVKDMLNNGEMKEAEKIEMIDDLQKLDCAYHFEDEINAALMDIYTKKSSNNYKSLEEKDLNATALEFRVLRQNGFNVSPEVFDGFMDGKRLGFNANLCDDTKGLLNLYEASFLSKEGDTTLELARDFSAKHLKQVNRDQNVNDPTLLPLVQRALDLPLHWRVPRMDSRFFIDSYDLGKTTSKNSLLLEFAKLDFNISQAVWWNDSRIIEKMGFVRDRVVENFIWALAKTSSPKYSHCRRVVAKLDAILCMVDDIYDIYGTLDELQLFTDAIERWDDITQVGHFPEYMQLCYFALHNFVNEVAYDIFKEHNVLILPYLRKEYELKRGDVPKAIQCYANEAKVSLEVACDFVDSHINETWNKINKCLLEDDTFTKTFVQVAMNVGRVSLCMYQYGDGHGIKNLETQNRIQAALFEPIPLII